MPNKNLGQSTQAARTKLICFAYEDALHMLTKVYRRGSAGNPAAVLYKLKKKNMKTWLLILESETEVIV